MTPEQISELRTRKVHYPHVPTYEDELLRRTSNLYHRNCDGRGIRSGFSWDRYEDELHRRITNFFLNNIVESDDDEIEIVRKLLPKQTEPVFVPRLGIAVDILPYDHTDLYHHDTIFQALAVVSGYPMTYTPALTVKPRVKRAPVPICSFNETELTMYLNYRQTEGA